MTIKFRKQEIGSAKLLAGMMVEYRLDEDNYFLTDRKSWTDTSKHSGFHLNGDTGRIISNDDGEDVAYMICFHKIPSNIEDVYFIDKNPLNLKRSNLQIHKMKPRAEGLADFFN